LSRIGFALVNWLFRPSEKIKITTLSTVRLLSVDLVGNPDANACSFERTDTNVIKSPKAKMGNNVEKLVLYFKVN
jgi:hypothetical protein